MGIKRKYELITKAEFARRMSVSPPRVSALIKKGMIQARKDGKINFEQAKQILEDNRATSSISLMKSPSYLEARRKREILKFESAEIELRNKKKGLIEREEAIKMCADIITIS
ncbi:unnamed protein product, partial [marine sediment metagenome]